MREYGKIAHRFWEHPELQELDDETKLVALHLLTSRHANMLGCYHLNPAYIAADLRKPVEAITQAFHTLSDMSFITFDTRTNWVWIRRFLAFNNFENPNVAKAAVKVLVTIPHALAFYQQFAEGIVELGAWGNDPHTIASRDAILSGDHTQSGRPLRRLSQAAPNPVAAPRTRNPTQPNPTQPNLRARTEPEPSPKGVEGEELKGQSSTASPISLSDELEPLVLAVLDSTTGLEPDQRRAQLIALVPDTWNPYPEGLRPGGKGMYQLNDPGDPPVEVWPTPVARALNHLRDPIRTPRDQVPMIGSKPARPPAAPAKARANGSKPVTPAPRATAAAPAATPGPSVPTAERVVIPAASYPDMRGVAPADSIAPVSMLDATRRLCEVAGIPAERVEHEMQHVRAMIDEDGADMRRDIVPTIEGTMDRRSGRAVTSLAYFRSMVGKAVEAHSMGDWTPEERRAAMRNAEMLSEQRETSRRAAEAAQRAQAPVPAMPIEDDAPGIDVVVAKAGAA